MPLFGPNGDVLVAPEWRDLAAKITKGDGLGWTGDERMYLQVGELHRSDGKIGRRLEVWRFNEDGSENMVAHWLPSEQHMVTYELARMRVDAPGHENVIDRIDAHNDALEAEHSRRYRDNMGALLEHAIHLNHDRSSEPKTTFYGMGHADKPLNVKQPKQPDA
jgi:hypothetical protein